jgi:signal transduction histidine kinase
MMTAGTLAKQHSDLPEDAVRQLATIKSEVRRAADIVSRVLKFAGRGAIERQPHDLNQVVRDSVQLMEKTPAMSNAAIEVRLAAALPEVEIVAAECAQVLINLVQNAVEANAKHITLSTEADEHFVNLRVRDDGTGIPRDQIPKIFDPFFSTRGDTGGTGLGLSIVHRIVTDSRGTVDVESEPGTGTMVTIRLPRSQSTPAGC